MISYSNGIWTVPLDPGHAGFTWVNLKRRHSGNGEFQVVVVDIALLMNCCARDLRSFVIPPVTKWNAEKKEGIFRFIDPRQSGIPEMPQVSFKLVSRKRWFGLFGTTYESVVSFTNGRHRSRYLDFAGATCIPVETPASCAPALLRYCGCPCCNGEKAS